MTATWSSRAPGTRWTGRLGASLAVAWVCAVATVAAHDLLTTRAVARIEGGERYSVEIEVDAATLLAQLDLAEGGRPDAAGGVDPVDALAGRTAEIRRGLALSFDGHEVEPSLTVVRATPDATGGTPPPSAATLRLSGRVPEGARTFTFRYDLTFGPVVLVVPRGPETVTEWVSPRQPTRPVSVGPRAARGWPSVALDYVTLGFTHIVPKGLDHILFVLGLFLLAPGWRPLLAQVSAFTTAHSITLALAALRIVTLPSAIVEPLIAASIAYVAVENLVVTHVGRTRVAIVFAFGMVHGLGFAGVLSELGLPGHQAAVALVAFNAGVELGQLAVIGCAAAVLTGWRGGERSWRPLVARPASLAIALTGLGWTIERLVR